MNQAEIHIGMIIWCIPFIPMLAALFIAIGVLSRSNMGESGEQQTTLISYLSIVLTLALILIVDLLSIRSDFTGPIHIANWFSSGSYQANISFYLDGLSLSLMNLVIIISALMIKFSVNYMHREAGYQRFFMIMNSFVGAMLLIIMSGNVILTFAGWEIAGVCSYLLITYAYDRPIASKNGTRVFVTNRVGDAGFILAIFLSFIFVGSLEWSDILSNASSLTPIGSNVLAFAFVLAAMVKSAQVPFSPWIARALEGPTPSSAIFYGSLMVHAGVYLIIRIQPVLENSPVVMAFLVLIGGLTMIYSYLCNLTQTDVKSNLIFSTTLHVGFMFFSCGLGWFELASWHLIIHAVLRAYQFLHAPSLLHQMDNKTRAVSKVLAKQDRLFTASLNRFWLDPLANWLFVRPIKRLAHDTERFDDKVINKIVGLPEQTNAVSSIAELDQLTAIKNEEINAVKNNAVKNNAVKNNTAKNNIDSSERSEQAKAKAKKEVTRAVGLAGKTMQAVADMLYWFEEHLVLKTSGEGLIKVMRLLGFYLLQIEQLLSQPRYLFLLIIATFIVII